MEEVRKCPLVKQHAKTEEHVKNKSDKKNVTEYSDSELHYSDYLRLDEILGAQKRKTDHPMAHDEHLFIVIHQNFELWFKQILYEVDSIIGLFRHEKVCERDQQVIVTRMIRVNCILRIMVQQFEVLETMNCVSFASFRDVFKGGASGFQSTQFRILEKTLGIKEEQRTCTFLKAYNKRLTDEQKGDIEQRGKDGEDLFSVVDSWLSRSPALQSFIASYRNVIKGEEEKLLREAERESDEVLKKKLLEQAEEINSRFATIFNYEKYQMTMRDKGSNLSYEAFMGALMIICYSYEPRFSVPYEILRNLMDMDVFITKWRFAHAMMAKRMIGGRKGTGGSGGYQYLRSTVSDRFMPFRDLFELATYVIAPQKIPPLTPSVYDEISQAYISKSTFEEEVTETSELDEDACHAPRGKRTLI